MERGVCDTDHKPKRETFKYEKEVCFFIGVAKLESKKDGTITGKRRPVFDYTGKKIVTINSYNKEIRN